MEIIIAEYNPNWRVYFNNEKKILKEAFFNQNSSINHIGSTSVPGLASKPIVDISVGVIGAEKIKGKEYYSELLKTVGYKYKNGSEFEEWILFYKRTPKQEFNLHIMPYNSKRLLDQLIFKNCLLGNKKLIKSYGWLKKHYQEHDDNLFYYMNKLPFVKTVVEAFKKGFSESSNYSEEEIYQYVQNNFIED